ncbi:RNA-guided endonuclease TnpB family protein [Gloeocapsopsis sp. IPPAS B-1203]|uniref:RNA-guided endonuclease InsQ/TnpB family protein n=1 Tax=Gloeocapsopsis sp. IPPAS B-1203 TaxID=2049454 RepID=UPI000C1991D3|nr:RNA-guided endonuclease TnpB family protein [Gloeocapsopsis sp. IPPAS B-1203]PIG93863.1 transposase [Gloeocapsopsis sp. IPPAS B-1203]
MITLEFKLKGKEIQYRIVDEMIRTFQFVRNKCLGFWMDGYKVAEGDRTRSCPNAFGQGRAVKLSEVNAEATRVRHNPEWEWAGKLESSSAQAASERAMSAIRRYYENCKAKIPGNIGFPKFQKNNRSVEYKVAGWKLSPDRKRITFTDKFKAGTFKLVGSYDLNFYHLKAIKRVRIVRRSDGYYCQFCVAVERNISINPTTGKCLGIDVGLSKFYTASDGSSIENPRYLRKAERALKRVQRRVSSKFRKPKKKGEKVKQSNNYKKACKRLGKKHLTVQRRRKDFVVKTAKALLESSNFIAYEKLNVKKLVKNRKLSKSISDAAWTQFTGWIERYGMLYKRPVVAVPPQYTSQDCSGCGTRVKKTLSVRTHICPNSKCQLVIDRDENAAVNILVKGLNIAGIVLNSSTVGQTGINASGQTNLCLLGENLADKWTG